MRYVHLYFTCIKRSMISRLEYKKDTVVALFSFFFSNFCSLAALYFILQAIPALAGYSLYEVGFFYAFSMLPIALDHLFSDEFGRVAYRRVKEGDMDMHFLRPVPVMFQVFAETFQPEGFGELILGVALIAVCASNLTVTVTFGSVAVLFVGSDQGRVEYTGELKAMAAALPAGKTALFLEHTDDMPLVYAASDVVVSASSAQPEAFGRVIPEAQAMGRIVVGTAHGGACETVADGVTGFLTPPGDAAALAAALDRALEMPADEAAKMRAAAVESVRENFSTARMCERTLEFYSKIHSTLSHGNVI